MFPPSDGTGHRKERHEPASARVHGDVQHEARAGRADGDVPPNDQGGQELAVDLLGRQQRLREHGRDSR